MMSLNQVLYSTVAAIGIAALATSSAPVGAQPKPPQGTSASTVAIDADDIGGVVRGAKGPEAGVWVIAETTDLPTRYTKSVVTDDQGRYVIPDLPTANYQVWVRGYGLVDSPKMRAKPGQTVNLTAVTAPNEAAAAHYYPAIYWYAMMKIPPAKDFGGSTDIPKDITRDNWIQQMNNTDCIGCHQLGQEATRTIPAQFGKFDSGAEAWMRRITVRPGRRDDDQPHRRPVRRRALQVFRRLDRPRRQGRTAEGTSRRGRRASSAISSSRPGTGRRPTSTCTT